MAQPHTKVASAPLARAISIWVGLTIPEQGRITTLTSGSSRSALCSSIMSWMGMERWQTKPTMTLFFFSTVSVISGSLVQEGHHIGLDRLGVGVRQLDGEEGAGAHADAALGAAGL